MASIPAGVDPAAVLVKYKAYKVHCEESLGVDATTLHVADLPYPYTRGIITSKPIKKGTAILKVPAPALLTIDAAKDADMSSFYNKLSQKLDGLAGTPDDNTLALVLLYHKHVLKQRSRWAQHLGMLPTSYDLPWGWTDDERNALHGAGLHEVAVAMLAQLRHDHAYLSPLVDAASAGAGLTTSTGFSLSEYEWALSTVWSRGVDIRVAKGRLVRAIAPFFDMFNHHPAAQERHVFDAARNAFIVIAEQSYEPGEQVCLNYGAYTSLENIKLRGFAVQDNPHEWFEMQLAMEPRPDTAERIEMVRLSPPTSDYSCPGEHGLVRVATRAASEEEGTGAGHEVQGSFQLHAGVVNEALFRFIRIILTDSEDLAELASTMKRAPEAFASVEGEAKLIQVLSGAYIALLENLKATPEEYLYLASLSQDWKAGSQAMSRLTAAIQKHCGYTPKAAGAATGAAAGVGADEDEVISIKTRGKGVSRGKGRGQVCAPAPAVSEEEAATVEAIAAHVVEEEATPSAAEHDGHARRLQLVAHVRRLERGILEWHLRALEEHSQALREIVETHNAEVAEVRNSASGAEAGRGTAAGPVEQ